MAYEAYETPQITVLGEVSDMTQKHGILFDFPAGSSGTASIDVKVNVGKLLDLQLDVALS